jgi:hypothetical protein
VSTSSPAERSNAPVTDRDLARLLSLADEDHAIFTGTRPEYAGRRVAVVLAQGAAQHHVDGRTGVKDFDVWSFYAAVPGEGFPFGQRKRHVDFGPSPHGRNAYRPDFADRRRARWERFTGRRVDLMVRALPVGPDAPAEAVITALREWLTRGSRMSRRGDDPMPSPWWLAQKAVVMIEPAPGTIVWPLAPER